MIEKLISRVFATRDAAHLEHWRETSGYRHEVLGGLYGDLVGAIDKLVEAHMGAFDVIGDVALEQPKIKSFVDHLESDLLWISENRLKITSKLPALDNILQELEAVYLSVLFKLKRLK